MEPLFEIIHEDNEILVVNKPAGLVCHPTKRDVYSSLISRARLHLGLVARPELINRLDRETSGIVLIAKHPGSARDLRRLWESRRVTKEYWAIVHGHVKTEKGVIDAPLGRDTASKIAIKDCVCTEGAAARTQFIVRTQFSRSEDRFTWLTVIPETGRKHQIRIHLAHIGHPLVGDKLYGGDEDVYLALVEDRLTDEQHAQLILPNHALHAREVRFEWRGVERWFSAEPEGWFSEFLGERS